MKPNFLNRIIATVILIQTMIGPEALAQISYNAPATSTLLNQTFGAKAYQNTWTGNNSFTGTLLAPTMSFTDSSTNSATTAFVKGQNYITSSGAPVQSVFGRTGAVAATSGDYSTTLIPEGVNQYFTNARSIASAMTGFVAGAGTITSADSLLQGIQKNAGNISALTTSSVPEASNLYFTNARDIGATLTGFSATTGSITSTDSVLSALQKDAGNSSANATAISGKEPSITTGTTSQYWRGDKTFQTLNTTAVSEGTNQYFTGARAINSPLTGYTPGAGTIAATDSLLQAIQKDAGNLASLNTSSVPEGSNQYFTNPRVIASPLTGFISSPGTITATDSVLTALQKDAGNSSANTTAISGKEPSITAGTTGQYYRGDKTFQTLDKTAVGLANLDNTSDVNKPVSTAQQTALNLKANLTGATFSGRLTAGSEFILDSETNTVTTGASAALSNAKPTVLLTSGSLSSLGTIANPVAGKVVTIVNRTGAAFNVLNEDSGSATLVNRIITGTGAPLVVAPDSTLILLYSSNDSRWHIAGGSGSTGIQPLSKGGTGTNAISFNDLFTKLSPLGAAGDLIYGSTIGTATNLAIGTASQVLGISSGLPAWVNPASGLSTQGLREGSSVATTQITAPNNQFTTTATGVRLLETGNGNVLANPDFENTSAAWTVSNATAAADTTNFLSGKQSLQVTMSSAPVGALLYQSIAPTAQVTGQPYEYNIAVKTSLTTLSVCALLNNAEAGTCATVYSDNAWHTYPLNLLANGSFNGVSVKTTATVTGTFNADSSYVGPYRNGAAAIVTLPTITKMLSGSGSYTPPSGVSSIRVRMVGGGGGGAGSGTSPTAGGAGGGTAFGTMVANGGGGGNQNGGQGGAGGTSSLGTGPIGTALQGGNGSAALQTNLAGVAAQGGSGASSALGGGGGGGSPNTSGTSASANTGSGGGAGGSPGATNGGGGGGAGGFIDAIINNPSGSYAWAVGAAGTNGTGGTGNGGAGGTGYIEVTENYAAVPTLNTNAMFDSTGMIVPMAGTSCPAGTLPEDGSAVSRTTYAALFAKVGTTYGAGDGSTTFNLPNGNGVFHRGAGSQTIGGITYTGTQGTTQGDQAQGHYHGMSINGYNIVGAGAAAGITNGVVGGGNAASYGFGIGGPTSDGTNGTPRTGSENRPANIAVKYCIVTQGVIGMPVYQSNYAGRFTNSSGQSISNTVETTVTGWTKDYESDPEFNVATGIFTPLVSGKYTFTGQMMTSSGATNGGAQFSVDIAGASNVSFFSPAGGTSYLATPVSLEANLTAGTAYPIQVYQASGIARTLYNTGQFNHIAIDYVGK